jgi:hypothetical protein
MTSSDRKSGMIAISRYGTGRTRYSFEEKNQVVSNRLTMMREDT